MGTELQGQLKMAKTRQCTTVQLRFKGVTWLSKLACWMIIILQGWQIKYMPMTRLNASVHTGLNVQKLLLDWVWDGNHWKHLFYEHRGANNTYYILELVIPILWLNCLSCLAVCILASLSLQYKLSQYSVSQSLRKDQFWKHIWKQNLWTKPLFSEGEDGRLLAAADARCKGKSI